MTRVYCPKNGRPAQPILGSSRAERLDRIEALLALIDAAVGPPEAADPEEEEEAA